MALFYNNTQISTANNVYLNSQASNAVYFNNNLVWEKQKKVYPGIPVANTQNLGWTDYFTVTNTGTHIKVDAFGGTERGWGRVMLGPFNSWGYSKLYFANLHAYITNSFSKIKVALGDINGNVVQQLIYYYTGESGAGYDKIFVSSDLFTINTANGNYYLILEVESGATYFGKNATIEMNGCYLV